MVSVISIAVRKETAEKIRSGEGRSFTVGVMPEDQGRLSLTKFLKLYEFMDFRDPEWSWRRKRSGKDSKEVSDKVFVVIRKKKRRKKK